jgi:hypothetical protein
MASISPFCAAMCSVVNVVYLRPHLHQLPSPPLHGLHVTGLCCWAPARTYRHTTRAGVTPIESYHSFVSCTSAFACLES